MPQEGSVLSALVLEETEVSKRPFFLLCVFPAHTGLLHCCNAKTLPTESTILLKHVTLSFSNPPPPTKTCSKSLKHNVSNLNISPLEMVIK